MRLKSLHPRQQEIINSRSRFNVVACGRRFGKDIMAMNLYAEAGLEGQRAAWFVPNYPMLVDTWREVSDTLRPIASRMASSEHRIELKTGGVLDMWSLEAVDSARGKKYHRVIVNEAAQVPALLDAWNLVIRPTLMDYQGDAWFLSTPRGRNGFWQMHTWDNDTSRQEWRSWTYPTGANPFIAPSEIEAARVSMPERAYRQEVLAEFIEDGGGVFRNVRAAATAERWDKWREGAHIIGGLDWALSTDYTVLTLLDAATRQVVHVDRFNGVDYSMQRTRIKATAERFGVAFIIAEANAMGKPNNDELRRMGVRVRDFTTTNATKADIIESLASAFERGQVRIPADAGLIAELEAFESERLPSGMTRYAAPDGMHDDMAMSLALAYSAVAGQVNPAAYGWAT